MADRPDLLAHSAAETGRAPQPYEEHVLPVERGALARADAMLASENCVPPPHFRASIGAAARFHDLGKLDRENQAALRAGRHAALRWDHIDAGVAQLVRAKSWPAAWLVRAHHSPGLPSKPAHFVDGGRKLRGRRHDELDHATQIQRTDEHLRDYLRDHEAAVGAVALTAGKAFHGLPLRLALSALVDADHSDSAAFDNGTEETEPPLPRWPERIEALDRYVSKLDSGDGRERNLNRALFYKACTEANLTGVMASCEGPVGIGKTTAVSAYLLRQAVSKKLRRLIIVAPYTNIISQIVDRLRKALVLDGENPHEVVVEHHHRADFASRAARDLAVLWKAPVIVTTAVQFFETLSSNEPATLRKLHALPGSAVFIDEAHAALPAHLWKQYWKWLRELGRDWNCHFVFASGSLVRFWENGDIVENPEPIPELLAPDLKLKLLGAEARRIHYETSIRFTAVDELVKTVLATCGPRLVILNTVQSAAIVARAFLASNPNTLHLSTALAPKDREPILRQVERKTAGEECDFVLVATSIVEAGVDLSFRTAFRERFSVSSLIQVGGRVNRHGGDTAGSVVDFTLEGDGIIDHPGARYSRRVLAQFLGDGAFQREIDPAELVSCAMATEITQRGRLEGETLAEAEEERKYPSVAQLGRVIVADTRVVVVDTGLLARLEARIPTPFRQVMEGSVQIWMEKIGRLRLSEVRGRPDIYSWPYKYDPDFLGYMHGLLDQVDLSAKGFAFV